MRAISILLVLVADSGGKDLREKTLASPTSLQVEIGPNHVKRSNRPTVPEMKTFRLLAFLLLSTALCQGANTISLSTSGLTVSGSNPNYSANVGTIDGLGLGTPATNVSLTAVSGVGQLWWFTISVSLGFQSSGSGTLSVKVGTNYSHSSVQNCLCMPRRGM